MNVEQVLEVVSLYRGMMGFAGDMAEKADHDDYPTRGGQVRHMLFMCDEIEKMLEGVVHDVAKQEKAMRWLGFMQGVLWSQGVYKLSEMRAHNS